MPRFYFNLRRAHLHLVDKHGENCATLAEALEHGVAAILALVSEEGRFRNWTAWAVEIHDEHRRPAATLPFALVLKADHRRKS